MALLSPAAYSVAHASSEAREHGAIASKQSDLRQRLIAGRHRGGRSKRVLITGLDVHARRVVPPAADAQRSSLAAETLAATDGQPVEVTDEETPSRQLVANPDGTFTMTAYPSPLLVWTGTSWVRPDDTLTAAGGSISPQVNGDGVAFSSGGGSTEPMAQASLGGDGVAVSWPTGLPTPTLSGATATYAQVAPGIDLNVTAEPNGFDVAVVLRQRPTSLPILRLPLMATGLWANRDVNGDILFRDRAGILVARMPAPSMFSAAVDAHSAEHTQIGSVIATVSTGPGGPELDLTPDWSFLTNPSTAYPVTIDPSLGINGDVYTQSAFPTSTSGTSDTELKSGTYDGSSIDRSFLRFDTSVIDGSTVSAATLNLYELWSWSCTASQVNIYSATGSVNSGTDWNNQPTQGTLQASKTVAYGWSSSGLGGPSSCPSQTVSFNVQSLAQSWSDSGASAGDVEVRANSESDTNGWKRFSSTRGSNPPSLSVTYSTNCTTYNGFQVCGAIRSEYQSQGGPTGALGNPQANAQAARTSPQGTTGTFQRFANGEIDSSIQGAFSVLNAIDSEFDGLSPSGTGSPLGFPMSETRTAAASPQGTAGTFQRFEGGEIDSSSKGTFAVYGSFDDEFDSLSPSGTGSSLGFPVGDTRTAGSSPQGTTGIFQPFEGGEIDSSSKGTFAVYGSIDSKYDSLSPAGTGSALGFPLMDQHAASTSPQGTTGAYQQFEGGEIDTSAYGTFVVTGVFYSEYLSQSPAGTGSGLGFPVGDSGTATTSPNGSTGGYQPFEGGEIDTSGHGTFSVMGQFFNEFISLSPRGTGSALGFPTGDQRPATTSPQGTTGTYQSFEGGEIDSSSKGTFHVVGAFADAYSRQGGTGGVLGFPTANSTGSPTSPYGTTGSSQAFEAGQILAPSFSSSAYILHDAINATYMSTGGASSCRGYPIRDQYQTSTGQQADFEGGDVSYDNASGATSAECADSDINGPLAADQSAPTASDAPSPALVPVPVALVSTNPGFAYQTDVADTDELDSPNPVAVITSTPPGSAAVTGVVTNANTGAGVAGAAVTLQPSNGTLANAAATVTAAGGVFAFTNIPAAPGGTSYNMVIQAPGQFGSYTLANDVYMPDATYELTAALTAATQWYDESNTASQPATAGSTSSTGSYAALHRVPPTITVGMFEQTQQCASTGTFDRAQRYPWRFYVLHVAKGEIDVLHAGESAWKANASVESNVGWYDRLHAKYPGSGYDLTNTTNDQCFKPEAKVNNNSWKTWINDILDERVHDGSGSTVYTGYLSGSQNGNTCSTGAGGGTLYQWVTKYLDENCGYNNWRSIVQFFYNGYTVGNGAAPPRPDTSGTPVTGGVQLNFPSLVSGSNAHLGWHYTVDARIGGSWVTIYDHGWDNTSRTVPTSFTYTTKQCLEYRANASNPVGTSQYATFGTVCPG